MSLTLYKINWANAVILQTINKYGCYKTTSFYTNVLFTLVSNFCKQLYITNEVVDFSSCHACSGGLGMAIQA